MKEDNLLKKLLALFIALFVSASAISASPASVRANLDNPEQGININESSNFISFPPALIGVTGTGADETWTLCKTIDDEACTAARSILAQNHLPPCLNTIKKNCIQSVYALDPSGVKIEGEFVKYATDDYEFNYSASEVNNLPQGKGQGGIWRIPGVTHSGNGDSYFVSSNVLGWLDKSAKTKVSTQEFIFNKFETGIAPIVEITGPFEQATPLDSAHFDNSGKIQGSATRVDRPLAERYSCAMMTGGICFSEKEFPKDFRFGMTVNLGNKLAGWFHGRIYDPVIDVSGNGKGQIITFEAFPVLVPAVYEKVPTANLTVELRNYLSSDRKFSTGSGYFMPGNSGKEAIEMAGFWIPLVKDKASTSRTSWTVRNLDGNNDANVSQCSNGDGKLAGVVTTNSLVYSAGPPVYNKSQGTLDYQVLSPHYTASGEEAIGSYDLVLRSDVARCIYGFTRAPIQATISIINPEGDNKVATTLVREKNGWLTLSAKGFTYSSPLIRVSLSQEAAPTPTPTAPKVNKKNKTTIFCVKGKITKTVTAVKPKCPTGFKKKSSKFTSEDYSW
jgi:hypothetical protein